MRGSNSRSSVVPTTLDRQSESYHLLRRSRMRLEMSLASSPRQFVVGDEDSPLTRDLARAGTATRYQISRYSGRRETCLMLSAYGKLELRLEK